MKPLFYLLPIFLFIATFQLVEGHQAVFFDLLTEHLGDAVWGGNVSAAKVPVLLATVAVMLAALAHAGWLTATRRKVDPRWWIGLLLVLLLGGVTLWLHDPTLDRWKPSVLYWAMGTALWLSPLLFKRNLLRSLLGGHFTLPPKVWHRLNFAWVAFFAGMGLLNLWVAHAYSVETWTTFKLFGSLGLVLAFTVAQALVLNRFVKDAEVLGHSPESR